MLYRLIHTRDDSIIAILRLTLGVLFLAHGAQKLLGLFGGPGLAEALRSFELMGINRPLAMLAICAEFFGGLCLIAGFLGRVAVVGILTRGLLVFGILRALLLDLTGLAHSLWLSPR